MVKWSTLLSYRANRSTFKIRTISQNKLIGILKAIEYSYSITCLKSIDTQSAFSSKKINLTPNLYLLSETTF